MIYKVYKNLGETPLECLERIRIEQVIDKNVSMTFAGRLDPAAEGEMIIVTDNDIKNKEEYLKKDKVYLVDYILGISTDSGDLLGIVTNNIDPKTIAIDKNDFQNAINSLIGTRNQKFHKFSSKVADGKPLWQHAKEGNYISLDHEIIIYSIELIKESVLDKEAILKRVEHVASLVKGDFRQEDVLNSFKNIDKNEPYLVLQFKIHTGSGAYMRVLGEELGEILGIPICAYSIVRTSVLL